MNLSIYNSTLTASPAVTAIVSAHNDLRLSVIIVFIMIGMDLARQEAKLMRLEKQISDSQKAFNQPASEQPHACNQPAQK